MKFLYAPWRMAYIKKFSEKCSECFLCKASKEDRDAENLVVYRGEKCFAILNRYPYNNGHLMIAPYKHASRLADLDEKELTELMKLIKLSIDVLEKEYRPDGFNVGLNLGRAAGAGLEDHLHFHIVPRWIGDTNFMPVISETKVIPESFYDSWKRIKKRFQSL